MKTEFELEEYRDGKCFSFGAMIKIIGKKPDSKPYVSIGTIDRQDYFIQDKDLERFAVNILKAIRSKKLK